MQKGIKIEYLSGLGLVAKNKRQIRSGNQYNGLIPTTASPNTLLNKDGSVDDTVTLCKKIVSATLNDTKRIAPLLKKSELQYTLLEVFSFIYDHIQYEEDKQGVEQLRRPARTWKDRKGDCDCMSIFVSSLLTNLNIPHSFRIVKMYGRSWFQHIYVVVPKPGKTDMSNRNNYFVIDPVLDKFNQEAPKINFKKDIPMENLAGINGIPIQYLGTVNNGVDQSKFGNEFEGIENFNGTEEQLGREWHRRMKNHLINTHSYITKNPQRVSAIYNPTALAGAYKELIGAWDSAKAREGALDRLSKIEESFLQPHLQGLGDIIHGDDDRLFGMLNADLNGLGSLGKSQKAVARQAAKAAKEPVKKRGTFTKVKQASKKVNAVAKSTTKKAGSGVKKVTKKVGHAVVKGSTTPIRVGFLLAMKTNFGKIGSRLYWGLFPKSEAMQHGVLADYWDAANKAYNQTRNIFVNKLKGDEKALRQAIITGRAAKVAKRGTHGLGVVTEASVVAASSVLAPLLQLVNKMFKGKKATASSPTDDGNATGENTDSDETSPIAQDNAEDNYNNEVVENAPEQEANADGSVDEEVDGIGEIGDREYVQGLGDLGKKIKSKPGTETHKRIFKSKVDRKAAKVAKKANKPVKKASKPSKKAAVKTAHVKNAEANKKMTIPQLIEKLKKSKAYGKMTPQQVAKEAIKIKNKTPEQIVQDAEIFATKNTESPTKKQGDEMTVEASNLPSNVPASSSTEQAPVDAPKEVKSNGGKILLGTGIGVAIIALAMKGKKKQPVNGLGGASTMSKHVHKMLIEEGRKIQKKLSAKGERLVHGYTVANKKTKKARVLKIK